MNAIAELASLQWEQQEHDDIAHRDILALSVQDRVKHMVLHFAKYSGHLAALTETRSTDKLISTLVDTFIICLACANALQFKLGELVNNSSVALVDLGPSNNPVDVGSKMLLRLAPATGSMAKACESLDHFERVDYHVILESGLVQVTSQCLAAANKLNLDLFAHSRARWRAVERKWTQNRSGTTKGSEAIRLAAKA